MASNDIVGKEGRKTTRKARRRAGLQLVIIEDSIDDLSERTLQFFSKPEAFRVVQETIRNWKSYSWSLPLPRMPDYDKFLKVIELQTKTLYEVGTIHGCGFHLEIQIQQI